MNAGLTNWGRGGYGFTLMKLVSVILPFGIAIFLSSCGLLQTATQVPAGLLKSVGRTVGVGLEQTEEISPDK